MNKFKKYFLLSLIFLLIPSFILSSTYRRIEHPEFQAFDENGDPCSGCLLYTYEPGTTTPKTTYNSNDSENTNPIVLSTKGRAEVYGTGYYKLKLCTDPDGDSSCNTTLWTIDNIQGIGETSRTDIGDYSNDFDAAITAIGATPTTLYINASSTMSTTVTVPATCTVVIEKGGSIDQSGNALTFNGLLVLNGGTITNDAALTMNGLVRYDGSYGVLSSTSYGTFGTDSTTKVYPEMWGANTTPGTTDMTAEIQAAVDSITAGSVYIHDETYLISSPIIPESNVHFRGTGTIKLANSTDDDMFDITGTDTDIIFEGLTFNGNGANQTGSVNTNIIHATTQIKRLTIRNCKFQNAAYSAIRLDASLAHEDVIIADNIFTDYYGPAVVLFGTSREVIGNNIFDNTGVSPSGNANGISVANLSYDVTISNNSIQMGPGGADTFGIETGNSSGDSSRIAITGNTVHCGGDANNGGISMTYTDHGTINGNNIYQAQNIGSIEVTYSTVISITGNTIRDSAATAIAVTSDNNSISVVGNMIDDFDGYGIVFNLDGGTQANFFGFTCVGNTIIGGNGDTQHSIYVNESPSYGLNISNNVIYDNPTSGIAINILSNTGVTCTGYVINGNNIYNHDRWINIGGTGTHANHVITGNNYAVCPTAVTIAGSGHIIKDNGPGEQSLTGTVTVDQYSNSGDIDSSGGAVTATLGDGYFIGQLKLISMSDASNSSTLSVTHHETEDPEVFTFDTVDEYWLGVWTGTEWATVNATATP